MGKKTNTQIDILNELAKVLHKEADGNYDNLSCCFVPIGDDGEKLLKPCLPIRGRG